MNIIASWCLALVMAFGTVSMTGGIYLIGQGLVGTEIGAYDEAVFLQGLVLTWIGATSTGFGALGFVFMAHCSSCRRMMQTIISRQH